MKTSTVFPWKSFCAECSHSPRHQVALNNNIPLSPALQHDAMIHTLPDDVLLLIISYIGVRDILALRMTSKRLSVMSRLRWVWHDAVKRHVIDRGLPIPNAETDLKLFSAQQLEARAVHAARFHENWCSPRPRPTRSIQFHADKVLPEQVPEQHRSIVNQVLFLPGRNGELLVTVVGRVVTCWEVPFHGSSAYRVAEYVCSKKIAQLIVNEDPRSEAVLASVCEDQPANGVVEILALGLDKFHGCFYVCAKLRGSRQSVLPLHVMHGDYIVFGDPLFAWFCVPPAEVKRLGSWHAPLVQEFPNKILAIKIVNKYMVIVRERTFQLDYAPSWKGQRMVYDVLRTPFAQLDVPATEAVVAYRDTVISREDKPEWPSEPVSILIRCSDDGLDTIQQYDLLPKAQDFCGLSAIVPCKGGEFREFPLPCVLPEFCAGLSLVAPSCGHLQVSPSGKGFWIETRNVTTRHAVHPARCLVGFHLSPTPPDLKCGGDRTEGGTKTVLRGNDMGVCSTALYSRRCDMSEIIWKKYTVSSTALEDTVGRIAVGDRTGKVEVLDFA